MSLKPLFPFMSAFFAVAQSGLEPLRRLGMMGKPDDPVFFAAGDSVPWWVQCRWPMGDPLTFTEDSETFWLDGDQHVHPLFNHASVIMHFDTHGGAALIVGAPTYIHSEPRPKGPKPEPTHDDLIGAAT